MAFEQLFGAQLLNKERKLQSTSELLADKEVVGLYFSAHWCGPCRGFTPKLAETYKKIVAEGKKFEIVFVSSDQDDAAFQSYAAEMPWLCLPFENRDGKKNLSKKYKVQGIPTLVFVDQAGKTITTEGREAITSNPEGFPWTPKSFHDILKDDVPLIRNNGGGSVNWKDIKGKKVGFYFSAHWCPPCRNFTPQFATTYKKIQEKFPDQFEVIFVSSDRSQEDFTSYHNSMPWLALDFSARSVKEDLSTLYGVAGIPCLVIVDSETGKTINANARGSVGSDPEGDNFPWAPKPVNDLSDPSGINETTSLIVFPNEISEAEKTELLNGVEQLAKETLAKTEDFIFFTNSKEEGVALKIRTLCSLPAEKSVQVVLLDIPDEGAYYVLESQGKQVNKDLLQQFLDDYKAGKLTRKQLS